MSMARWTATVNPHNFENIFKRDSVGGKEELKKTIQETR